MAAVLIKIAISLIALLLSAIWLRLLYVLPRFRARPLPRKRGAKSHLLVVLGSGGHTAEMIYIGNLDWSNFTFRTWIVGAGDNFSSLRAQEFESNASKKRSSHASNDPESYRIVQVPRARKIHQPLLTSPISCLQCAWACLQLLLNTPAGVDYPDIILTNGPATATVLIFTSVLLRFFDYRGAHSRGKMRTVYVESWARVKKMSLSGRLLCWVADRVLVQWEQLKGSGGRAEYHGVLCF
ncbi:oligosaccharide biosynthesis protein Alg14-like protein [Elsinoe ampelina]|uniref:UDP-N-acetylglucosamine transferase subunit ALG14 n=1 Tax=Elsinoe ampelina TaxID=302913 RepID=A0A6A6GDJ7_9PEZI|nr:oligosaccharide biosynthesis protein Alg14-like protein [Elsinoe ampelina]